MTFALPPSVSNSGDGVPGNPPTAFAPPDEVLRLLFATAPLGVCVISPELDVVQVNAAMCAFAGVNESDFVGHDVTDLLRQFLTPGDFARVLPMTTEVLAGTRDRVNVVVALATPAAGARAGQLSAWVVRNPDNTIRFAVATFENMTATLEREAALVAREQLFEAMVQHSSDVVVVLDEQGQPNYVSPAITNVLGYTPEEATVINPRSIVHPDDYAEWAAYFRRCLHHEPSPTHLSVRLRHTSGSWRYVDLTAFNLLEEPSVQGIVVNYHDETERMLAAAELRRREERFRALVEDSSDIVALINERGNVTWVSPAIEHVLGHNPADVTGHDGAALISPDDYQRFASALETVWRTPRAQRTETLRVRDSHGEWRWMETVLTNRVRDSVLQSVVLHLKDITERKTFEEQLALNAVRDELTHLANRNLLYERIAWAFRVSRSRGGEHAPPVPVIALDLDRFKLINEAHNHQLGDQLLCAVGERLVTLVQPSTTVARLGGDEFALCFGTSTTELEVLEIAESILVAIREPFIIDDTTIFVTASVGIAFGDPNNTAENTPEALLRDVDTAMYVAKNLGGDRFEVFAPDTRHSVLTRLDTEHALRRALSDDQFRLYYQPVIDLASGHIVAAEALIRWEHPERGLVPPVEFIPIAEDSGLILRIGEWVLYEAARQRAAWRTLDPNGRFGAIWVNVSAKQLTRPGFVDLVSDAMRSAKLAPGDLGLEITETVLMSDQHAEGSNLEDLAAANFPLAIDDFGTGYSSLTYLRRFRVDVVKLDRTFVDGLGTNPDDTAIVSAVVGLGHSLGIRVSAEGIETTEQLVALRALGCDTACGYLLARPLPAHEVEQLIATGQPLA
ncbi:MAG: sensor domain-containing protein [Acidimicrobiia bacterium]